MPAGESRGFCMCKSPKIPAAPSQAHRRSGICASLWLTARESRAFLFLAALERVIILAKHRHRISQRFFVKLAWGEFRRYGLIAFRDAAARPHHHDCKRSFSFIHTPGVSFPEPHAWHGVSWYKKGAACGPLPETKEDQSRISNVTFSVSTSHVMFELALPPFLKL